jgi:NAD(P)-dependent dehydrogenase (short-subunit alcohol dehydrogenase family)
MSASHGAPASQAVHALVIGASRGIGLALTQALLARPDTARLYATGRHPQQAEALQQLALAHPHTLRLLTLDVTRAEDFTRVADTVRQEAGRLHRVFHVAGLLHDTAQGIRPERRVEDLRAEALAASFAVNATAVALSAKALLPPLAHDERALFASLSARVGSIADNRLGGWYAYRAAKAAQNQISRSFAVEAARRAPNLVVASLHPGTVETDLSAPFRGAVAAEKLFSPERAATQLLAVTDALTPALSGRFWAWDGQEIPW